MPHGRKLLVVAAWFLGGCGGFLFFSSEDDEESPPVEADASSADARTASSNTDAAAGEAGPTPTPPKPDAGVKDGNSGVPDATAGTKLVFVTSKTFDGRMPGRAGADARCNDAAANANLAGNFTAWLSVAGDDVIKRLPVNGGPWVLRDGTKVVDDRAALAAKMPPLAPILKTETGATVTSTLVWTGTDDDGTKAPAASDCQGFTSAVAAGSSAIHGDLALGGKAWTNNGPESCTSLLRLVCFEL